MPVSTRHHYIIAYDIENNKNRTKLASLLLDYGDRMQLSVFEADLDERDVQRIMLKASAWVGKGDSLRIYPVCKLCREGVITQGRTIAVEQSHRVI